MSFSADDLYELLPAIHRVRDAEKGYPLRELLSVLAEQVEALQENLEQLYDDQFIETSAPWVAPYIGDLIGYRGLHGVAPGIASPRADVANTIRYRRRKGTASMLEQVARDVTGWPARVVEFFQLLGWTQYMNHHRLHARYAPDLRQWDRLLWRDTAFDSIAHTADMRRIETGAGRHNIPNIGLFLWRVRAFPLTRSPAVSEPLDPAGRWFRFDPLGRDGPLYSLPQTEDEITHLAQPRNVPLPLARRWLKAHLDDYYGSDKSLYLELAGANPGDAPQGVAAAMLRICDLSDLVDGGGNVIGWAHAPVAGATHVAVDPVLGRIAFPDPPATPVLASYHYGFTIAIGGGEYERTPARVSTGATQQVHGGAALQPALDAVQAGGVVEATDSARYAQTPGITVDAGATTVLRSVNGTRPLLVAGGDINLVVGADATLILDGWTITAGALVLAAGGGTAPRRLVLRDCTLVPGSLAQPDAPMLRIEHPFAQVELDRCITGPLHVARDAKASLRECIVDATARDRVAVRGPGADVLAPAAALTLDRCTIIGKVHTRELTLASDTLFIAALAGAGETWPAPVWADRRQAGCVRFSFVPPGSRTPRRFRCQPAAGDTRMRPHFTSLRHGDPGYCQLREATPGGIRQGAHDESEMGVMHDLYQPQREINLRVRLDEYLRFGLRAGIFHAS